MKSFRVGAGVLVALVVGFLAVRPADAAETIRIDEWVEQRALSRVDFIKLDVEGAELNALRGAEKTIRAFKPRMAVSVYHQEDDLITIPEFLRSLNCGYKLLLDHFTIYNEETILFADPQNTTGAPQY